MMPSGPENLFPEVWSKLCNARRSGRLGHAYCLVGDEARLLEEIGMKWVQLCVCLGEVSGEGACGVCGPCRQLKNGVYPELRVLRPQSRSRQILVEEIREFEHGLQLTAAKGLIKAGLIVEADRLVVQAQNAFLKTLEEPPRNVVLILLTTQPRLLLPTIRSRCQIVSLRTNRRCYDSEAVKGVFPLLAQLRRGAGSAVAMAVAHKLRKCFAELNSQAEKRVQDGTAPELAEEVKQDEKMRKRLEQIHEAKVKAEYLRLRQEIVEAIQVWFMQQSLIAHGAPETCLPNPEFFEAAAAKQNAYPAASRKEAEENLLLVEELARDFAANVDERLALESFCLMVCQHSSN